jgi:hypothetical protein
VNARIAGIVYGALTLLAVVTAATAKGYVDTVGEFSFVVLVSAVGLFIAHFWSQLLSARLTTGVDRDAVVHEAVDSSTMFVPAVVLLVAAWVTYLITASMEISVTVAMAALTGALFAYTWLGTKALLWSLGTAAVGILMIVFKVVV